MFFQGHGHDGRRDERSVCLATIKTNHQPFGQPWRQQNLLETAQLETPAFLASLINGPQTNKDQAGQWRRGKLRCSGQQVGVINTNQEPGLNSGGGTTVEIKPDCFRSWSRSRGRIVAEKVSKGPGEVGQEVAVVEDWPGDSHSAVLQAEKAPDAGINRNLLREHREQQSVVRRAAGDRRAHYERPPGVPHATCRRPEQQPGRSGPERRWC